MNTTDSTQDKHIFMIEEYVGGENHKYKIRFVECGRVKTVPYAQIRGKRVTYSFRTPKVVETLKKKKILKKHELPSKLNLVPKFNLRVMALDAATIKTGYCVFDGDNLMSYGLIQKSNSDRQKRIEQMVDEIIFRINQCGINFVVLEDIFLKNDSSRNVTTLIALANLQGAILYQLSKQNIRYELISPSVWKSHFNILKHRAEGKESAISLVEKMTGIKMQEDTAESMLIAMYFLKCRVDWS